VKVSEKYTITFLTYSGIVKKDSRLVNCNHSRRVRLLKGLELLQEGKKVSIKNFNHSKIIHSTEKKGLPKFNDGYVLSLDCDVDTEIKISG